MKKGKPRSKLRLFKQEKIYTCAVACLRTVLAHLDCAIDEPTLSALCQTNADGTSADDLVKAANHLGFAARKEYCSSSEVQYYLANGVFPILYINLLAIDGLDITHAVVLETMTRNSVTVFRSLGRPQAEHFSQAI